MEVETPVLEQESAIHLSRRIRNRDSDSLDYLCSGLAAIIPGTIQHIMNLGEYLSFWVVPSMSAMEGSLRRGLRGS
jgi:hypothetical protein